jgi:hypothetical protein
VRAQIRYLGFSGLPLDAFTYILDRQDPASGFPPHAAKPIARAMHMKPGQGMLPPLCFLVQGSVPLPHVAGVAPLPVCRSLQGT